MPSAIGMASPSGKRMLACSASASDSLIFATLFSPMRGSVAATPLSMHFFRLARSVTPPSFHRVCIVLGPRPGICISGSSPLGTWARSSLSSVILP